jgi:tetratricopeptide (TPR) repeat protein
MRLLQLVALALALVSHTPAFAQQVNGLDPGRVAALEGRLRADYMVRARACIYLVPVLAAWEGDISRQDSRNHLNIAQACWNVEHDELVGLALARAHERMGNHAQADAAIAATQQSFPNNALVHTGIAGRLARAGDGDGAGREIAQAIAIGPPNGERDPDNWRSLVLALFDGDAVLPLRLRLYDEAWTRAERRRDRDEKVRILTARARVLAEAGRHQDALADTERAMPFTSDNDRHSVLLLRARAQRSLGNLDHARGDFAAALALSPQVAASETAFRRDAIIDQAPTGCRAAALAANGLDHGADDDVDAAMALANECIAAGHPALGLTMKAGERSRLGDRGEALSLLDQALAADPSYAPAFAARAVVYEATERYAESRDALTRAIELDSTNARYYMARASILTTLNDHQSARADQEHALGLDPRAEYRLQHIRTLVALHDQRCALAAIDAAGRHGATSAEIRQMRQSAARVVARLPREERGCDTPVAYGALFAF